LENGDCDFKSGTRGVGFGALSGVDAEELAGNDPLKSPSDGAADQLSGDIARLLEMEPGSSSGTTGELVGQSFAAGRVKL
jgi:hypothetical protein